jgi:hypothetical protein
VKLGECGDSITFEFDGMSFNINIRCDCCPIEHCEHLLKSILRNQIILADQVGLPEAYEQARATGHLVCHPVDNNGNYLVDKNGRFLYADGPINRA